MKVTKVQAETSSSGAANLLQGSRNYIVHVSNAVKSDRNLVLEYHLDDGTTKVAKGTPVNMEKWSVVISSNSVPNVSKWHVYPAIHEYVMGLTALDNDDPDYVDEITATEATRALNLASHSKSPPPKVFSHGGDAVVLRWEGPHTSNLLTVSGSYVKLLAVNKETKARNSFVVDLDDAESRHLWLQTLGGISSSTTLVDNEF